MIRHIVMWKFKETAEGATKAENLHKVKGCWKPCRIPSFHPPHGGALE